MSDTATISEQAKPKNPMVVLQEQFDSRKGELIKALPPHMSFDRFVRAVRTACTINPDLMACDRASLFIETVKCASDGLMPDGREAALVPFKTKVTYIPMFRGLLKLFRNSGECAWIDADVVYEGEEFHHYKDETGEHYRHVPSDERDDDNKIRRAYAVARTKNGDLYMEDMTRGQIMKHRNMSRTTREDAPWKAHFPEMAKKTALRGLSKLLPMSTDLDVLMRRDEEALLGVESVESARASIAARPSTQAVLDQFGATKDLQTAPEPSDERRNSDSPTRTEAEQPRRESEAAGSESGEAPSGTTAGAAAHNQTAPATNKSRNPAEYLQEIKDRCAACESAEEAESLVPWFVSDQQRKYRNACGMISDETKIARSIIDNRIKLLKTKEATNE